MSSSAASGLPRKECHLPFWTPGSGHYGNVFGKASGEVLSEATPFLLSWIDSLSVNKDDVTFTVADLGSNDGYASLPLFDSMIRMLREKHGDRLPIQIIYEDQEKCDYNSLFQRIADVSSPFSKFSNVYPMATNTNFYKQCFLDSSCDVILSSVSCQWLENPAVKFKDCVFHEFATEEELRQFQEEGARDWVTFLTHRARELKPGGLLLALIPTIADDEAMLTDQTNCADNTKMNQVNGHTVSRDDQIHIDHLKDMEAAWKELRDDKIITQEEYESCSNSELFRTKGEIMAPFESVTSPVREAGLSLAHLDHVIYHCAFKALWREKLVKEGVDDRNLFAETLFNGHRAWSQTTFQSSLSDMRSEAEKGAILDDLYKRVKARVVKRDPETYKSDMVVSRLVARKM